MKIPELRDKLRAMRAEEWAMTILALVVAFYHIYCAIFGAKTPMRFRTMHLAFLLPIAFLRCVGLGTEKKAGAWKRAAMWLCAGASLATAGYITFFAYERYTNRIYLVSMVQTLDMVFGIVLIVLVLYATKLTIGWPLAILGGLAVLYLRFGAHLPAGLRHAGYSWTKIVDMEYMGTYGIFGIPLSASASFIFLFMIFGAFLEASGTGEFLINWATGLFGSQRGGPAKIAVVSSGLLGMISGSPTSNVVTTGVFTIPMMKRVGYSSEMSGAIEATASTGGQIMPPIMGAAAFILAEFTGVPYLRVAACAAIPALLYYLSVLMQVHFQACKKGYGGLPKSELPNSKKIFLASWNQLLPIVVLVALMIGGRSTHFAAVCALFSIPICGLLHKGTRMSVQTIIRSVISGAQSAVLVAVACAASGIVIGAFNMSGLAVRLTSAIVQLAGSSLFLALVLTMLAALVLGMGIPTTAAYITCVAVVAPALTKLGISTFVAHMFVLYFAVVSSITPPVAIAAYAAAGLTKADPIKIGIRATQLGIIAFLVPYMFVYQPALLLQASWQESFLAATTAVIGTVLLASGLEGYLLECLDPIRRVVLGGAGLLMIYPGLVTDLIGVAMALVMVWPQYMRRRQAKIFSSE